MGTRWIVLYSLSLAGAFAHDFCSTLSNCPQSTVLPMQVGNHECDLACMNAFCRFDQFTPGFSDCDYECYQQSCRLWLRGNGECDEECNSVQCGWDFGDCRECGVGCRESQVGNGECEQACNTSQCGFDAGDCEPFHSQRRAETPDCRGEIWVSALGTSGDSGTLENPYNSLSLAMANACNTDTTIYLLSGIHNLEKVDETLVRTGVLINALSPLNRDSIPRNLIIATFLCSNPPFSNCTNTPATIFLKDFAIQLTISSTVTIRNVHIDARRSLVEGCISEMCFYCPVLTNINQTHSLTDKNLVVKIDEVAVSTLCQKYSETSLFVVNSTGVLTLDGVNITDVRYEPLALVSMKMKAKVNLLNVHLSNITTCKLRGAIILSEKQCDLTSCSKGSFSFIQGSVKTLNNGFQYNSSLSLGGFCAFSGLEAVRIQAVAFERNLWTGSLEMGIFNFKQIEVLELINCTFQYNLAVNLLMIAYENVAINKDVIGKNQVVVDTEKILISIQSSAFQQNYVEHYLIMVYLTKDFQNIAILGCIFDKNFVNSEAILAVISTGDVTSTMTEGWRDPQSGVLYAPRHCSVTSSTFSSNTATAVLSFDKVPNVYIDSCALAGNNGPGLDSRTLVWTVFSADKSVYLSQSLIPSAQPCLQLLYAHNAGYLAFKTFAVIGNYCEKGPSGLKAVDVAKKVDILNGTFEGNESQGLLGTVLYLEEVEEVKVAGVQFLYNTNKNSRSESLVYIKSVNSVSIESSIFEGSSIASVSSLSLITPRSVKITQSRFTKNVSRSGFMGVLYVLVSQDTTEVTVTDVDFEENYSEKGSGAILLTSDAQTNPLLLTITNVKIHRNFAYYASALFVSSFVHLSKQSECRRCSVASNFCAKGSVYFEFERGFMSFIDSTFHSNLADVASVLYQTDGSTAFTNCEFSDNASGEGNLRVSSEDTWKTLTTTNCTFRGNQGETVFAQKVHWSDAGSRFISNNVTAVTLFGGTDADFVDTLFQDNTDEDAGAAVTMSFGSKMSCRSCTFHRNRSGYFGGAVYIKDNSEVHINNNLFDSNTAEIDGSALAFLINGKAMSTIFNTTFTNNYAGDSGTIALLLSIVSLDSIRLISNRCGKSSPGMYLIFSVMLVQSSSFFNQSGTYGSTFMVTSGSALFVESSDFSFGKAVAGGLIYASDCIADLRNSSIANFSAVVGGAIVALTDCEVTIQDVYMRDIKAVEGGLIAMQGSESLAVTNSKFERFANGGVTCERVSSITISGTSFVSGNGDFGSVFACEKCTNISIESSVFRGNNATIGGAVYLNTQESDALANVYTIKHSTFLNNSAQHGGAIYTNDVSIAVQNCTFVGNTASKGSGDLQGAGSGGAVSCYCSTQPKCLFEFAVCRFEGNRAEVSGGAIEWVDVRPNVTNCGFVGNAALYGANISSFPVAIRQVATARQLADAAVLPSVASGQPSKEAISVALIDHYGNIVVTDNSSKAELRAVDVQSTALSGVTQATAVRGVFTFDQFTITADPGSNTQVTVSTAAVDSAKQVRADDGVQYFNSLKFHAEMRLCELGESLVRKSCEVCAPGKYSLDPNSTSCSTCPPGGNCLGNYTMVPLKGYWRAGKLTATFYKCLFTSACVGSPEDPLNLTYTGLCADGYMGRLCETCSLGFSRTGKYECSKCPERSVNIVRLVFIAIGIGAIAGIMVSTTLKSAHREKSLSSIYIKILMNYLQIVMLTASFNLTWPKLVLELFSVQDSAGSVTEQAFSFDCYLQPEKGKKTDTVIYSKLIVMAIVPVLIAAAALIVWIFISGYKRTPKLPKDELIATIIILLFLAHPNLTKSFFSMFTCMTIEGKQYLLQQLEIQCWGKEHFFYTCACALPAILLWVIGVPAACLGFLVTNKRKLTSITNKIRLGFLFNGYRKKAFYWEFVILYRKIVIICCSVFLTTISIPIQALLLILILTLSLYFQDTVQPYTTPELNKMELKSIMCAVITIYCGLFFLTGDLGEEAKLALFISIVSVNVLFLWYWIKKMFGFYLFLAVSKVPCLRLKLGKIRKVKDGLDDDIFVDPVTCRLFPLPPPQPKPLRLTAEEAGSLQSMSDLYYLKVRYCNSDEGKTGAEATIGTFDDETMGCPNSPNEESESNKTCSNLLAEEVDY